MYSFIYSSANCQTITNINKGYGFSMLSSTQFFILGAEVVVGHLHMYNVNISSTFVTWGNKISCSSSPWFADYSESVLSSDGLSIYSLFIYGAIKHLYFACMSASTGKVAATRFRSSVPVSYVYGSALNKDYLIKSIGLT